MENDRISIRNDETAAPKPKDNIILRSDDAYNCSTCPYPVEILKIDDEKNTITFKCLNPKEKQILKTIPINEYLNSMRKYTYLYSMCSLCQKKQNEFEYDSIFSYCIKCQKIFCSDCIKKHLKKNKKNHPEYIIKNNEKNVKCFSHPQEKNLAFCLKCNSHICKECLKSKKHINHNIINIVEVLVTDEIKTLLNRIIKIYRERLMQLNKEKEKKKIELFNEKRYNKEKKIKQKKNKINELQTKLKKELLENEKLLNNNLYKLKLKYENEIKLFKRNFSISNENIKAKYERLKNIHINKFNEEIDNVEKDYDNRINSLEYNEKINYNKNLLSINLLLKNTQENYPDNFYNNDNINNVILNYYESKDKNIKQILSDAVYIELLNKQKKEQIYEIEKKELEKEKVKKEVKEKKELEYEKIIKEKREKREKEEKNNIYDKNNKIIMTYLINEEKTIKILDENFVINNKGNYKLFINKIEYEICEYIEYEKFGITKNDYSFKIILIGLKNKVATNLSYMFKNCYSLIFLNLQSFKTDKVITMENMFNGCTSLKILDLSSFNTQNVINMICMFRECSSLIALDLSSFKTQNVKSMLLMFYKCSSLRSVNLSSFNMKNVINMWSMFRDCSSLKVVTLPSFSLRNVTNIGCVFNGCGKLNKEIIEDFNRLKYK